LNILNFSVDASPPGIVKVDFIRLYLVHLGNLPGDLQGAV